MGFEDYVEIFAAPLELGIYILSLYQIATRKGAVSWDFAACNIISHVVLLTKCNMSAGPLWLNVLNQIYAGMSVLMVLLLLKYRDQRAYSIPICIRWPVLVSVSVALAWAISNLSRLSPWYYFCLYADIASIIPQGYILTKRRKQIDNLSVFLFSMWMMFHTLHAIYLTVNPAIELWTEPHLISSWAAVFVGSMPIIRFFFLRERLPSFICQVV